MLEIEQNIKKDLLEKSFEQEKQKCIDLTAQFDKLKVQFEQQIITKIIPDSFKQELGLFNDSKIVCSDVEKTTIRNFFTKNIKQVKLLYRASENEFSAKRFHEKCDGIADTVTVIWTEFDKKIGGFTPLKWSSPQDVTYATDNGKESFLFSLTHNDKFTLQKPQYAILNKADTGVAFGGGVGGCDVVIK